jgi:predicted phosphodiesterase/biotin operon repressor
MEILKSHEKILKALRKRQLTVKQIAEELGGLYAEGSIRGRIAELRKAGYEIKGTRANGDLTYYAPTRPSINAEQTVVKSSGVGKFKIAVISDTHLGAVTEDLKSLNEFYDFAIAQGITEFYHAGDIMDGFDVYPGQINDLIPGCGGLDNQLNYVIKNYPERKNVKTFFIAGNHDLRIFQNVGIDCGKQIANARKDLIYLGQYEATIKFEEATMRLVHPDGGSPYALSYRSQKYVEGIVGGEKPNMLVLGHLHTSFYAQIRNIHVFHGGCFQHQNAFLRRKGIMPVIGGWILEFRVKNKREINNLTCQWKTFFKT